MVNSVIGLAKYVSTAVATPQILPPYGASLRYIVKISSLLNLRSIWIASTSSLNLRTMVRSLVNKAFFTNC